jgi:hypothetical protein
MADQQGQNDTAVAEVTATGSADAEHDEELDALLSSKNDIRFGVSMALIVQIVVLWVVTLCSLLGRY